MRITYIHQHFKLPTEEGGGRPYEFARRLADQGHTLTVVAAGEKRTTEQQDGFTIERIATAYDNRMSFARRLVSFASFMARSSTRAARIPADVVFASSTPLTVAVPGAIASAAQRARFVFEVRDQWPHMPIVLGLLPRPLHAPARILERFAYWRADQVIALSPYMVEGVHKVDASVPTVLVPNCSDVTVFQVPESKQEARSRFGVPDETPLFYYAGGVGHLYDAPWLAQFATQVHAAGGRFLLAGDGPGTDVIRTHLTQNGIDPSSVLLGVLPRRDVALLARASDAAVSSMIDVPALEGSSLNKVFDAFAAGRPVVVNHGGWLTDLILENDIGWRLSRDLSSDEVATLVQQVSTVSDHLEQAARLAAAAADFDRDRWFNVFEGALVGQE